MFNYNKKKIHFVIGLPLTGKSTYIKDNFQGIDKYQILNYADTFYKHYGTYEGINDLEKSHKVYGLIFKELEKFMKTENTTLVIEYCTGFQNSTLNLEKLIAKLELYGFKLTIKVLETGLKIHQLQQLAQNDQMYFSSNKLNDHHYYILSTFLTKNEFLV